MRDYYFPSICVFPPQCIDITIDILAKKFEMVRGPCVSDMQITPSLWQKVKRN